MEAARLVTNGNEVIAQAFYLSAMKWMILVAALTFAGLGKAQETESKDVEVVVRNFLSAMAASDTSTVMSCMYYDFTLKSVVADRTHQTILVKEDEKRFLSSIAEMHTEKWEERISNITVHIDHHLALLWCDYEFYVDDKLSHKGADAFQLIRTDKGWKIFYICDTRHK